jgi:hypothetical protein
MRTDAPGGGALTESGELSEIGLTRSRPEPEPRPVFIAGPDRSGTTLMFALLASHPNISMVRRTNMWRYFHRSYGDLASAQNLERCLNDMSRYHRMQHLKPDADRIRSEFLEGEPTYGRLFALFHEHHAARAGKGRWGDKSLHTEHFADRVFEEFPQARIVHMIRDPRDRYASVRKRYGRDLSRVGAATGRWLESTRAGRRNQARFPDRYLLVRYEDLARDPEGTMRHICSFIDEAYSSRMLSMEGAPDHRGGNSSFGDLERGAISTRGIGRAVTVLPPSEIAFIELFARRSMAALGYERIRPALSPGTLIRFYAGLVPFQLVRMIGWVTLARLQRRGGARVPPSRLADASKDGGAR